MSADNSVAVLKTKKGDGYEYRVEHLQALENVDWDNTTKSYTNNDDIRIINAREMWVNSHVFLSLHTAMLEAVQQEEDIMQSDFPVLEYGIQIITIEREF